MISGEGEVAAKADARADVQSLQTPGALLQRERERIGLSIQQAAEGLHLDPWIVEAMEANRFLALGAPVYARGHLRKYAALLGLAPELVLERYDALSDAPSEPMPVPVITTTPPPRPKWPKYVGWAFVAALGLGIAAAAVWYVWPALDSLTGGARSSVAPLQETPPAASPIEVREIESPEPRTREEVASTDVAVTAPATAADVARPREPVASEPETEPAATASQQVSLRLEFSDPSWVEIYDAAGERLFYDIGQPGRTRTVVGTAPVNVVIGVVSAVSLQVNGNSVVVPRRANRDLARFVIEADGSIR
ncbi:MAG TPA: RodZ domain-containing protein [Steroidobacteraceae bacterium]